MFGDCVGDPVAVGTADPVRMGCQPGGRGASGAETRRRSDPSASMISSRLVLPSENEKAIRRPSGDHTGSSAQHFVFDAGYPSGHRVRGVTRLPSGRMVKMFLPRSNAMTEPSGD